MDPEEFTRLAEECFDEIPPQFRERVQGPIVVAESKRHRRVGGMLVLGECVHAPTWTGEAGQLDSTVFLYYGSFVACAERDPGFDVTAEIRETVIHEVQHHLEDRIGLARLRDIDWAEEQNALRQEGRDFVPRFWLAGERAEDLGDDVWAVHDDLFLEVELSTPDWRRAGVEGLEIEFDGDVLEIDPGEIQEDEEIFDFEGGGRGSDADPGDLVLVVRRMSSVLGRPRPKARRT